MNAYFFHDARGVVDGVNKRFSSPVAYAPASLEVFINGLLLRRQDEDGWTVLTTTEFELKEAPRVGDLVRISFRIR